MEAWQTKGKGKHSRGLFADVLQKGLMDALLGPQASGQSQKGGGKSWSAAGKGNGGGKGTKAEKGKGQACMWDECRAARTQQTTWGGGACCHCCGGAFSQKPPLEKMAKWAFDLTLAEAKGEKKPATTTTPRAVAKAKAKAKAQASATPSALAELRKSRLEQLRTAREATTAPTATQEVARVFTDGQDTSLVKVALDQQLVDDATLLTTHAKEVIDSMHGEHFPSKKALPTAESTLSSLLQSVESCASLESKETAEKSLKATEQAIACLQGGDTPMDDPVLIVLQKRKDQQQKDVTRLTDKAPSDKLRQQALIEAKSRYTKELQEEEDFCEKGRLKAVNRARVRSRNLATLSKLISCLEATTTAEAAALDEQHTARTNLKAELGAEVQALLDERIQQLDDKMSVELGSDDEYEDSLETSTETENQLAAATLQVAKHMSLSSAELERLQLETCRDEAVRKAEEERDLAREEKCAVELRVAKLEERFAMQSKAQLPAVAPEPAQSLPKDIDAMLYDLHREFDAKQALLPPLVGTPDKEQAATLKNLVALFAAVPWGAQMPAVSFHVLGAQPHFVHSLVGDVMWKDCWKSLHSTITGDVLVPFKMMGVLKHVIDSYQAQESFATNVAAGEELFGKVMDAASERKARGCPY